MSWVRQRRSIVLYIRSRSLAGAGRLPAYIYIYIYISISLSLYICVCMCIYIYIYILPPASPPARRWRARRPASRPSRLGPGSAKSLDSSPRTNVSSRVCAKCARVGSAVQKFAAGGPRVRRQARVSLPCLKSGAPQKAAERSPTGGLGPECSPTQGGGPSPPRRSRRIEPARQASQPGRQAARLLREAAAGLATAWLFLAPPKTLVHILCRVPPDSQSMTGIDRTIVCVPDNVFLATGRK